MDEMNVPSGRCPVAQQEKLLILQNKKRELKKLIKQNVLKAKNKVKKKGLQGTMKTLKQKLKAKAHQLKNFERNIF